MYAHAACQSTYKRIDIGHFHAVREVCHPLQLPVGRIPEDVADECVT